MKLYLSVNIKNYRAKYHLTQAELAAQFCVTPQAVSKWERELACPDLLLILDIADRFQVTVDKLLTHEIRFE